MIVEAAGGPLGVVVAGANVHDCKLLEQTIDAIVVERPKPTETLAATSVPGQGIRQSHRPRRGSFARPYAAHPADRRGKARQDGAQASQSAPLGRRTHARLVEQVPGHPGSVREEIM